MGPAVRNRRRDEWDRVTAINYPWREAPSFESAILDDSGIARRRRRRGGRCGRRTRCRSWRRRGFLSAWEYPRIINVFFVLIEARVEVERGRIRYVTACVIRYHRDIVADLALVGITLRWIKWLAYSYVSRPGNTSIGAVRIK